MSLRDSISNAITLSQLNWEEPPTADEIADAILALPEVREMMEKASQVDKYEKYIADWNEVEEWKEKAKSHKRLLDQLYEKDITLDLFMENLKGREKCRGIDQSPDVGVKFIVHPDFCPCHGTGTIVREATPEEVREVLEYIFTQPFSNMGESGFIQLNNGAWTFKLKSGAILWGSL